jgi:enoyl-CoA hydratase
MLAAIAGPAIGGDAELAYACDFRIANTKARFGNLEAQLGILAAAGPLLSPAGTGWEPRVKEILSSSAEGCATTNIVAAAFPRRALSRSESFLAGGASTSE